MTPEPSSDIPQSQKPGQAGRRDAPTLVSIVVPVFNEADNIGPVADAVADALASQAYELIFVDDGSADNTFARIEARAGKDERICGVALSRNFGHQFALAAGLRIARGDVVVTMDGDLQHPPSLVPTLIEKWRAGSAIVHTRRTDTADLSPFKRWTSRTYYRLFSLLCGVRIEPGMADFRLLDRQVVDELNHMKDGQLLLRAVVHWMGYRSAVVDFVVDRRHAGLSKYTLRKMCKLASDGVLSFSTVPLRIGLTLGALTALLSFLELLFVIVSWIQGKTVEGWASTLVVITLLFGVMFVLLGIQGQYILRLYEQAQSRPRYIIERIVRQST